MSALQRSSEFLFFVLGILLLACFIMVKRGIAVEIAQPLLHSIDLPLLLAGMLYGGSSLYASIRQEKEFSLGIALAIAIPMAVTFLVFASMNFALPSRAVEENTGIDVGGEVMMQT